MSSEAGLIANEAGKVSTKQLKKLSLSIQVYVVSIVILLTFILACVGMGLTSRVR